MSPHVSTAHRRRRSSGYEALNSDEPIESNPDSLPLNSDVDDSHAKRESLVTVGWTVLGWSFTASAALTVRRFPNI